MACPSPTSAQSSSKVGRGSSPSLPDSASASSGCSGGAASAAPLGDSTNRPKPPCAASAALTSSWTPPSSRHPYGKSPLAGMESWSAPLLSAAPSSVQSDRRMLSASRFRADSAGSRSSSAGGGTGCGRAPVDAGAGSGAAPRLRRCLGSGWRTEASASGRRSRARGRTGSSSSFPTSSACTHSARGPTAAADACVSRRLCSERLGGAEMRPSAPDQSSGGTRWEPTRAGGISTTCLSASTAWASRTPTTNLRIGSFMHASATASAQ
mmetsp:Transcript_24687/g.79723  ORF Transcript_24687/g.79723 Transcript_24687/m.79723 type:complete len:267 (-) Transcript_24687:1163-1963(-)|eukprot:scaffold7258_cov122-Isochrysis_galbana.AAC.8